VIWGNSGGPLIDNKGFVVGINSQIYALPVEGQMIIQPQINFALEASVAERIVNDILSNDGLVKRAFLGLEFSQTYEDYSGGEGIWMPLDSLPVISGVIPGSPAASSAAELTGAVVTGINGKIISSVEELLGEMEKVLPGKAVTLSINISGKKQDVTIVSQTLDQPQLNSICRYFFEVENGSTLSIGYDNEVIFKTGTGRNANANPGYSTKKTSGVFDKSGQEKIVIAAGLDADENPMMWRITSLSSLGAVLRLCGPYGFISLRLLDRNSADAVPEMIDISLSGGTNLKKTLWY
jgi:hypothetical protein